MREVRFEMPCPVCGLPLAVAVWPGSPARGLDPPEGPEVSAVVGSPGCPHGDDLADDDDFIEAAINAAEEADERAFDEAMDAKYDRWRDRD